MIVIDRLCYRLGSRLLLDEASVALPAGTRVGFVGRNGVGKSTLFRLLTGDLTPESGSVTLPARARLGVVAQDAPDGDEDLLATVLAADTERQALLSEAETARDPDRVAAIQTRLADIGAHAAPARAAAILHGLGFDAAAQARPCRSFSGGWRMRVALAAVLFAEPDLMLLDEPTNHLDLEGVVWLEDHLRRARGTLVVISHDRDFLDAVTDHTLHLEAGKLRLYRGSYSSFARQYAEESALLDKAAARVAAERTRLAAFVERFRAKASKARQAQSRVKRLEKLADVVTRQAESVTAMAIPAPAKPLAPPLLVLDKVAVGYGDRPVLKGITLSLDHDDRIGLLGANGQGKSTFVKLLSGRLAPMAGAMRHAPQLRIAYFAQHQLDELDADATPRILLRRRLVALGTADPAEAMVRAAAARLGFPETLADQPVERLSGGERARLLFGLAVMGGPHLVILDEPTNHLDIPAREALVEGLADYPGAVVLISHDRFLLEASCDRLLLVEGGTVQRFDDDLEGYAQHVLAQRRAERTAVARDTAPADDHARRRRDRQALRRELATIETEMARLGDLVARVDAALAAPDAFARAPEKAARLAADRAQLAARLTAAEERWLVLSEAVDQAEPVQAR